MKTYPSWAVAAAILCRASNRAMHIDDLTEAVIETNLTRLGEEGSNPRQSLGPQLTHYHRDKFSWTGYGYYMLKHPDQVGRNPKVREALRAMHNAEEEPSQTVELHREISRLRAKLDAIHTRCRPSGNDNQDPD